ncbi:MAG: hypothetical protein RLZZ479_688 [Bacteroidota bacterium]|jgi:hypothetical protein
MKNKSEKKEDMCIKCVHALPNFNLLWCNKYKKSVHAHDKCLHFDLREKICSECNCKLLDCLCQYDEF